MSFRNMNWETEEALDHLINNPEWDDMVEAIKELDDSDQYKYVEDTIIGELLPSMDDSTLSEYERSVLNATFSEINIETIMEYMLNSE